MSSEKDIYRYSDLTDKGYGSRTKLFGLIKAGKFPQPDADDGSGYGFQRRLKNTGNL